MYQEELSKLMAERLARIEEYADEPVTMDYVPWEDCLSDGMLAVLFQRGVTG